MGGLYIDAAAHDAFGLNASLPGADDFARRFSLRGQPFIGQGRFAPLTRERATAPCVAGPEGTRHA
jgi:hypothetical protein